ncbi:MAG: hypothetical protein Roseis2KO_52670 [Roseivirga sp.]
MKHNLEEIAILTSGVYLKPGINPDCLYLQAVHFDEFGKPDLRLKPQVKVEGKSEKHLLCHGDVLFVAKGVHNFAVCYHENQGRAVASSSFIVVRIKPSFAEIIDSAYLAWYLSVAPEIHKDHQKQLGTTIPSVSIKKMSKLEVKIPSKKKQHLIVKIHELRNQEKALMQTLEKLREMKIQQMLLESMTD